MSIFTFLGLLLILMVVFLIGYIAIVTYSSHHEQVKHLKQGHKCAEYDRAGINGSAIKASMDQLHQGEIKCHILSNSGKKYNAENWACEMNIFMKSTASRQLLSLKGHDIDEIC